MSNVKTVAKGEFIFKEGDKAQNLILIQSGSVQLCINRPKKNLDLATLGPGQICGEQSLAGATHSFSAMALVDTKFLELPAETYKQAVESAPQALKIVIKSLTDRMKTTMSDVRTARLEKDSSPCPEDQVAKVFGTIFHTANHKGDKESANPNYRAVEWGLFRQYSQRVFGESLKRLEQACNILVKMKIARYDMGKAPDNPEGPDEIQRVHIDDLSAVESFFEFFQYYYFKGGKSELLKFDELAANLLNHLIRLGQTLTPDSHGVVAIEYTKVIENFKNDLNITLNNDHFSRLEQKGVMISRKPRPDGTVWMSFELKEFQTTAKIWRILREVERWNEKGFVDLNEDIGKSKKKSGAASCPQCSAELISAAKFCSECGAKIEAKAA